MKRFFVGCLSSLVVPIGKLLKEGIDLTNITIISTIGCLIPIVALMLFVGIYAAFVERNETDMKRLFKICLMIPALIIATVSGKPVTIPEVKADELFMEIKCEKKNMLMQGIQSSYESLTNKVNIKYWILSEDKNKAKIYRDYIIIKGKKYYLISKRINKPSNKEGIIFDKENCKIINE